MKPADKSQGGGHGSDRHHRQPERCPICDKPTTADYRPFCSKRCADVDLSRWLGGKYAIPGEPAIETDDKDERQ